MLSEIKEKIIVKDIKLTIIVPLYKCENLIERCLESIPNKEEIEVIVINDCSPDNSYQVAKDWIDNCSLPSIQILSMPKNSGVGAVINKGYDIARGEYVMVLCDDDALYTERFDDWYKELDGTDIVYYDMEINNGEVLRGCYLPGASKAYRLAFIGDLRRIDKDFGGDMIFWEELLTRNPSVKDTNVVLYKYNYPRENSLMDRWGEKNEEEPRKN
jgi:glycosyltransferase involved in cell wall biosynthesis